MLSDVDVINAIDSEELVIEPFEKCHIRSSGLTFHLGSLLLKPKAGTVVDLKNNIKPIYEQINISNKPYLLKSGEFILAHTKEQISVSNKFSVLIEGRSTLARLGLTVVQTAMQIDSGVSKRIVTLEPKNNGPNDILLYFDLRICRLMIFELNSSSSFSYDEKGRYKFQTIVGEPILGNDFYRGDYDN